MNRREALKAVVGIAAVAATGGLALAGEKRLTTADILRAKAYLEAHETVGRHLHFQNFYPGGLEQYADYVRSYGAILAGPDLITLPADPLAYLS